MYDGKIYTYITAAERERLAEEFRNPNAKFFKRLKELVLDDRGAFVIRRLNDEISRNVKAEDSLRISMVVRKFAKRILNLIKKFPKDSVWKTLSNNDNHFSDDCEISRETVLALGFVFRLNSEEIDSLLLSLDYNKLYTRSAIECAYIYACDLYQKSEEYKRFCNDGAAVDDDEFICNFIFFNKLAAHETELAPYESEYINNVKKALGVRGNNLPRTITRKNLESFIEEEAMSSPNKTAEFSETLRSFIETSDFGNETRFYFFLNNHRDVFVLNRERSLRYIFNALYRYIETPRLNYKNKYILEKQLSLNNFYKRFSVFLDGLNLFTPDEIFIRYYFSCDGEGEPVDIDTDTYCYDFFSDEDDDEKYDSLLAKARLDLIHTVKKLLKKSLSDENTDVLTEAEETAIRKILFKKVDSDTESLKTQLKSFKRVLIGQNDCTKLLFVLLYMFTSVGDRSESFTFSLDAESETVNRFMRGNLRFHGEDEGSMEELDVWLEDSGFPTMVGDPLRDFVEDFFKNSFKEVKVDPDSYGKPVHFEEVKGNATNSYLTPILLQHRDIEAFKNIHKNIKSLYDEISTLLI